MPETGPCWVEVIERRGKPTAAIARQDFLEEDPPMDATYCFRIKSVVTGKVMVFLGAPRGPAKSLTLYIPIPDQGFPLGFACMAFSRWDARAWFDSNEEVPFRPFKKEEGA